jgi:hypothetical protein
MATKKNSIKKEVKKESKEFYSDGYGKFENYSDFLKTKSEKRTGGETKASILINVVLETVNKGVKVITINAKKLFATEGINPRIKGSIYLSPAFPNYLLNNLKLKEKGYSSPIDKRVEKIIPKDGNSGASTKGLLEFTLVKSK